MGAVANRIGVVCLCATALSLNAFADREDVAWNNGSVELRGTLHMPDSPGPHTTFIFLHGSGPDTRTAFTMARYARELSKRGIAVLVYDKRGTGESTGDWLESTYEDLARDAATGIDYLLTRSDVDPDRIGVIGASEGGWTGPLAASISGRVSLMILISAPAMSPIEQGCYELATALCAKEVPEDQIAEAVDFERLRWEVMRNDSGWEELAAAVEKAKGSPWYDAAERPEAPDPANAGTRWYARNQTFDPIPVLKQINIPVLLLYSKKDKHIEAQRSAQIMQDLANTEGKNYTIVTYPEGGHNLTPDGIRFPDDHWDRIVEWIGQQR